MRKRLLCLVATVFTIWGLFWWLYRSTYHYEEYPPASEWRGGTADG